MTKINLLSNEALTTICGGISGQNAFKGSWNNTNQPELAAGGGAGTFRFLPVGPGPVILPPKFGAQEVIPGWDE